MIVLDMVFSFLCALFGTCNDEGCRDISHAGTDHFVCSYAVADIETKLFLNASTGKPFGGFRALQNEEKGSPKLLMNGGMYHDDLSAVGLHIENGQQSSSISTKGGWGNFHLLPNGVFWGKDGALQVTETKAFIRSKVKPDFATQSGPMLVINGKLHPRFLKDSDSLKIRNGVGISRDGKTVHFAISKTSVTFWDFGELFQNQLEAHNALFLDGTISAVKTDGYSQGGWRSLGPIIGVFEKSKP